MTREEKLDALKRMVAAYEHNHNRMAAIAQSLRKRAEAMTLEERPKQRHNGRHKATWTGADERHYLNRFFELQERSGAEIASLLRKLERQRLAIHALARKLGLNDPPDLADALVIHPGFWLPRR